MDVPKRKIESGASCEGGLFHFWVTINGKTVWRRAVHADLRETVAREQSALIQTLTEELECPPQ